MINVLKKASALILCLLVVLSLSTANIVSAAEYVTVRLDGQKLEFDVQPQIINGRTMVPLRKIFEAMGATVNWNNETQTAIAFTEVCHVEAQINNTTMTVNSTPKVMDISPILKDGRTLIPARFVAEAFGADVQWDEDTKTVSITSANVPSYVPEKDFYIEGYSDTSSTAGMQTLFSVSTYHTDMIKVPVSDVKYYKSICWYTEPMVAMYSAEGRVIVVPEKQKDEYKKVGWYANKNEIDLQGNRNKVNSLVYSSSRTGSLTGTITYQYNKFIGTRADVGAKVMLIQTNHIPLDSDSHNMFFNDYNDPMIYCTEVDGSGNYYLDNIPAGEYYLFIQSKATYEASNIAALTASMVDTYLRGKVTDDGLDNIKLAANLYSFAVEKIEIKENQIQRYSEDWGYSY